MWITKLIDENLTRQHVCIIIVLIGTVFLALSTKPIEQDGISFQTLSKDGKIITPNQTYIDKSLFYIGLEFIFLGSLLQW